MSGDGVGSGVIDEDLAESLASVTDVMGAIVIPLTGMGGSSKYDNNLFQINPNYVYVSWETHATL